MSHANENLEICTDDKEAWNSFIEICCDAFADENGLDEYIHNSEMKKKFIRAYFKYLYESDFSDGRAGLACVKVQEDGLREQIAFVMCVVYSTSARTDADKTEMTKASESATRAYLRQDKWIEMAIHKKMISCSEDLNVAPVYGCYMASSQRYSNRKIGSKYCSDALDLLVEDGIKRGAVDKDKPALAYATADEYWTRYFHVRYAGVTEIAHLHCPNDEGRPIKCFDEMQNKVDESDCYIVTCKVFGTKRHIIEHLKSAFNFGK